MHVIYNNSFVKWAEIEEALNYNIIDVEMSMVEAQLQERERWSGLRRAVLGEWLTEMAYGY